VRVGVLLLNDQIRHRLDADIERLMAHFGFARERAPSLHWSIDNAIAVVAQSHTPRRTNESGGAVLAPPLGL
jgi:hypothetical protein